MGKCDNHCHSSVSALVMYKFSEYPRDFGNQSRRNASLCCDLLVMLINAFRNNQDATDLLYNLGHQLEEGELTEFAGHAASKDIDRTVPIPARKHTRMSPIASFCWIISANALQCLVSWLGPMSPTRVFDADTVGRCAHALLSAPSKIEGKEESLPASREPLWRCTVRRDGT